MWNVWLSVGTVEVKLNDLYLLANFYLISLHSEQNMLFIFCQYIYILACKNSFSTVPFAYI